MAELGKLRTINRVCLNLALGASLSQTGLPWTQPSQRSCFTSTSLSLSCSLLEHFFAIVVDVHKQEQWQLTHLHVIKYIILQHSKKYIRCMRCRRITYISLLRSSSSNESFPIFVCFYCKNMMKLSTELKNWVLEIFMLPFLSLLLH